MIKFKKIGITFLTVAMLLGMTGCTKDSSENKTNSTNTESKEDTELDKLKALYTDDAVKTLDGFASDDAQLFIYSNLGKDVSNYTFKDLNGNDISLGTGEKTVIEIVRYDCSACISSASFVQEAEAKFNGNGYRFIQMFSNGEVSDIDEFYKNAEVSTKFTNIIPSADEVNQFLYDMGLSYVPAFLFVDESGKISLGMVGYSFTVDDFELLATEYAFAETKLYDMLKDTKDTSKDTQTTE